MEGPRGSAGTRAGAGGRPQGLARLRDATPRPPHTNFAHNFPRSFFETTQKHCNSNDANSMFEQAAGELHAKLMIDSHNWATYSNPGPGRGAGGRRQGLAGNTQTISTARLEAAARPAGTGRTTSRRAEQPISTPRATGVEGTGRSKRPGRGAGGRRQGQGGPRDRPLRAAGSRVAISRAGRRPPAHTAARARQRGGYRSTRPSLSHCLVEAQAE